VLSSEHLLIQRQIQVITRPQYSVSFKKFRHFKSPIGELDCTKVDQNPKNFPVLLLLASTRLPNLVALDMPSKRLDLPVLIHFRRVDKLTLFIEHIKFILITAIFSGTDNGSKVMRHALVYA